MSRLSWAAGSGPAETECPVVVIPTACAGDVVDTVSPCSTVNHLRWDLSAQQIRALTTQLIEQTKCVYDRVGAQDFEDVSYESTLKALADVEVTYTGERRQSDSHPLHRAPPCTKGASSGALILGGTHRGICLPGAGSNNLVSTCFLSLRICLCLGQAL